MIFISKSPAYLKLSSVEARYLVCWMQQIGIISGKFHSCSYISLIVGTDMVEMHKELTINKSDM